MGKRFKRNIRRRIFGTRYFRIWGWPLSNEANVKQHMQAVSPDKVVLQFGDTWVTLLVFEDQIGDPRSYSTLKLRSRHVNASITGTFYQKRHHAQKLLAYYAKGVMVEGLADMIEYHKRLDEINAVCSEPIFWEDAVYYEDLPLVVHNANLERFL